MVEEVQQGSDAFPAQPEAPGPEHNEALADELQDVEQPELGLPEVQGTPQEDPDAQVDGDDIDDEDEEDEDDDSEDDD